MTTNNSNAIIVLSDLISGGGGHIIIPGPTYTATRNIDVSVDSTVTVTGNVRFYGNGHVVDFGKSSANFIVNAGKFIVFENVILKNLASDSISLGAGANVVYGNGTCVEYNDTDNLSMNMTFSGTTLFEACCKRIKMNNSLFRVLPGGNLTVHGTLLDGLKGSNVRAEANWSTINFKNSHLYLSSDYSFTTGKILFEMDVEIAGTNKFVYAPTNSGSKILSHSKLILDTGLTFSYSPSSSNRGLLGMEDASSVLFLNGCSVHSTLTGMRLTKGTLIVDHKNKFYNPGATSLSQAIAFGDGTASNDLGIEIMPGGRIQVQSGQLAYQNAS